jgi:hypothetical protein
MRIYKAVCSFALLALTGASAAPAVTADPRSDFDCAIVSEFFYRVAKKKQFSANDQKDLVTVALWYETIWQQDHPGEDTRTNDRFIPLVDAIGEHPQTHLETLKGCIARANANPVFIQFATTLQAPAPNDAK